MKQSVSFLKLKLTNNTLDQHGHVSNNIQNVVFYENFLFINDSNSIFEWKVAEVLSRQTGCSN